MSRFDDYFGTMLRHCLPRSVAKAKSFHGWHEFFRVQPFWCNVLIVWYDADFLMWYADFLMYYSGKVAFWCDVVGMWIHMGD